MLIDFNCIPEAGIPNLNGGDGVVSARMSVQKNGKMMIARIPPNASIGMHRHETSDDINYVISGTGIAVCGGVEEKLSAGVCHYCPKGCSHSIANDGDEDLVLFTAVPELK